MVETLPIESIIVGERFRKELAIGSLMASIQSVGLLQPICVDENNKLIAGHRRLEACRQLGWTEIPAHVINLAEAVRGEFAENQERKNFTPSELEAIREALEPRLKEEAKQRQEAGVPAAESDAGRVDDKVAKMAGVSRDTLRKAKAITKAAEQEPEKYEPIKEAVDRQEISINEGYRQVTGKPKQTAPKPHEKEYSVTLPAFLYSNIIEAVDKTKDNSNSEIVLRHDGTNILAIDVNMITVATSE
jgi:ParB/RepB/Spo0J family partition protein